MNSAFARQTLRRQQGAALLLAMLTVALVATLAAGAAWQQWRAIEIETAERQRVQASWILTGALDWSRLILREDARANRNSGNADHLGEPWATPLEEARLSSFLAVDKDNNADEDVMEAFLSGEIIDAQSRLNFANLTKRVGGRDNAVHIVISTEDLQTFKRLFETLGLPPEELENAANLMARSADLAINDPKPSATPLVPTRYSQLSWLGLSDATLATIEPYVTMLPERSKLNINTASAEVLSAVIEGMDLALAQYLVAQRAVTPMGTVEDLQRLTPTLSEEAIDADLLDVRSRYFEVRGRLRLDNTIIEERSLVSRRGLFMQVVWRERMKGG
ncbi:type II secretion system minor pseudopilin GspK [Hydrogenophaga sp. 5NK40-0174]|uniref:type II secretion system minor pseudopilin GspK n=1 Tax=Hydrogenophaga sp. 5NK40-0174 TaxID=3127649 RepID=UPI003107988B